MPYLVLCGTRIIPSEPGQYHDGNIFRVTGALLVTGELPSQMPVTRSFDVFFDLRLNIRLSKQPRRR